MCIRDRFYIGRADDVFLSKTRNAKRVRSASASAASAGREGSHAEERFGRKEGLWRRPPFITVNPLHLELKSEIRFRTAVQQQKGLKTQKHRIIPKHHSSFSLKKHTHTKHARKSTYEKYQNTHKHVKNG